MAETISVAPAFARDGSGTVAMALARPWGLELYRISPLFARHAGIATPHPEGPVAYLGSIAQYVPLPESAATNSGDGPEEVYTREEVAAALTAGVEAAQENTNDHASLKVVEAATLARLRNPLAQVPPPDPSVTEEDGHTVTVHVRLWGPRAGWYCEYSALPGRLLGPWTSDTVITDLIESAGMAYEDAYALVEGNVDGTRVTVNTRR
ncbi:hypothetical protein [Streptomyces sp. NPDC097619]|uniref:hypothetical protein n=1 Tax=Streptomyces sp. NPDC097619 TaxID=3157228 RepID=UPI003327FBDB